MVTKTDQPVSIENNQSKMDAKKMKLEDCCQQQFNCDAICRKSQHHSFANFCKEIAAKSFVKKKTQKLNVISKMGKYYGYLKI